MFPLVFKSNMLKFNDSSAAKSNGKNKFQYQPITYWELLNSLTAKSILAGEKLVATYSIST